MDLNLITPDEELEGHLKKARESINPYRWIMIIIDHLKCKMIMQNKCMKQPTTGEDRWERGYQKFLEQLNQDNRPFFLLVHIDSEEINWILIHMSPPKADTRQKMVAASTKATLKNFFGSILITTDLFIEDYEDLHIAKVVEQIHPDSKRRQIHTLQEIEEQRQQELQVMDKIEYCNHSRSGGALHFNCLLDKDAMPELKKFEQGKYACISFVMSTDLSKVIFGGKISYEDFQLLSQTFDYEKQDDHDKVLLPEHIQPGYILFRFKHLNPLVQNNDDNEVVERYIMVCYVPIDVRLTMKLRFAYSVNQTSFVEKMNDKLNKTVTYIEVDGLDEVTVKRLFIHLYPCLDTSMQQESTNKSKHEMKPLLKFEKPVPKGRGPRRMIK